MFHSKITAKSCQNPLRQLSSRSPKLSFTLGGSIKLPLPSNIFLNLLIFKSKTALLPSPEGGSSFFGYYFKAFTITGLFYILRYTRETFSDSVKSMNHIHASQKKGSGDKSKAF